MRFRVVCAWCGREMGVKFARQTRGRSFDISHSICPECKDRIFSEFKGWERMPAALD